MAETAEDHKDVPDFMKSKDTWEEVWLFDDIDHRSQGEYYSTQEQPKKRS